MRQNDHARTSVEPETGHDRVWPRGCVCVLSVEDPTRASLNRYRTITIRSLCARSPIRTRHM